MIIIYDLSQQPNNLETHLEKLKPPIQTPTDAFPKANNVLEQFLSAL